MRSWIKKTLLGISSTVVGLGIIVLPFLIFVQPSNEFVFGNFQSYMSDNVKDDLSSRYKINWQYYGSNAEIPTYIQNKTLDLAIATNNMIAQLAMSDQLLPIPWDEFNLTKNDGSKINSYKDLNGFVSDATWWLSKTIGGKIKLPNVDGEPCDNLLAYCVPYFLQDFTFSYRGKKIKELSNESISFKAIFDHISNDAEFTSKESNVMMIDDSRSVYDIARFVSDASDINPSPGILNSGVDLNSAIAPSIQNLNNTYDNIAKYYTNKKKRNILTFNSDSSIVLNKIALNQTKGAFMYNGDAIYAAMGGDNESDQNGLPQFGANQDFYSIVPKINFYALDGVVINKSIDPNKKKSAIEIIKSLCLSGLQQGEIISEKDPTTDDYKYLSAQNFSFLNYTPCYQSLYEYAIDPSENGYFSQTGIEDNAQKQLLIDLIKINSDQIKQENIELPVTELTKSNINLAYLDFKNKI